MPRRYPDSGPHRKTHQRAPLSHDAAFYGPTIIPGPVDCIQARALDRAGELMRQIPASKGGSPTHASTQSPGQLSVSPREQARIAAGMSNSTAPTIRKVRPGREGMETGRSARAVRCACSSRFLGRRTADLMV
jgi:hypothetical protein